MKLQLVFFGQRKSCFSSDKWYHEYRVCSEDGDTGKFMSSLKLDGFICLETGSLIKANLNPEDVEFRLMQQERNTGTLVVDLPLMQPSKDRLNKQKRSCLNFTVKSKKEFQAWSFLSILISVNTQFPNYNSQFTSLKLIKEHKTWIVSLSNCLLFLSQLVLITLMI